MVTAREVQINLENQFSMLNLSGSLTLSLQYNIIVFPSQVFKGKSSKLTYIFQPYTVFQNNCTFQVYYIFNVANNYRSTVITTVSKTNNI